MRLPHLWLDLNLRLPHSPETGEGSRCQSTSQYWGVNIYHNFHQMLKKHFMLQKKNNHPHITLDNNILQDLNEKVT